MVNEGNNMVSEVPTHDSLLEQLNHSIQSINELTYHLQALRCHILAKAV